MGNKPEKATPKQQAHDGSIISKLPSQPPRNQMSFMVLVTLTVVICFAMVFISLGGLSYAQGDPTQQAIQTLVSGIQQQFTLTAQQSLPLTLTYQNLPTRTPTSTPNAEEREETLSALVNEHLTQVGTGFVQATVDERVNQLLTATAAQQLVVPVATLANAQQQQTIDAMANSHFTETATLALAATSLQQFNNNLTSTAAQQPTPTATPTPSDLQIKQTLVPLVNGRITQTADAYATQVIEALVQATLDAQSGRLITLTAQAAITATANQLGAQQTSDAFVTSRLTQTAQALVLQTVSAKVQGTTVSNFNQGATSTAQAVQADLLKNAALLTSANIPQLTQTADLTGHSAGVEAVAFSPDGSILASASLDGSIRLWNVNDGTLLRVLPGYSDRLTLSFSPNGIYVASGSTDGTVRMWDIRTGEERFTLKGHRAAVTSVAFSPTSTRLASASLDGQVFIWNIDPDSLEAGSRDTIVRGGFGPILRVIYSTDGLRLFVGNDTVVRVWEVSSGFLLAAYPVGLPITDIAVSRDNKLLAVATNTGTITIRDANTGAVQATLLGHKGAVNRIAFSPDGNYLVSAGSDNTVRVWSVADKIELTQLQGHTGAVRGVDFSSDGAHLASGASDASVKTWSVPVS